MGVILYSAWGTDKGSNMLAVVSGCEQGETDAVLRAVAASLRDQGVCVAGAVQVNTDPSGEAVCDMDLQILSSGALIRISQSLGPHARGCRLDPDGVGAGRWRRLRRICPRSRRTS